KKAVSFTYAGNKETIITLRNHPLVSQVIPKGDRYILETEDTDALLRFLIERKLPIKGIDIEQGRLEDAFEQLTVKEEVI
ncbi:hypothetical protein AOA62_28140, partial [Pseudomonas sp. 2995-3]